MSGKPASRISDAVAGGQIVQGSRTVLIGSQGGIACSVCFNGASGFNRLNHSDDLMLSKTGFTHSDLFRWQIDYAA